MGAAMTLERAGLYWIARTASVVFGIAGWLIVVPVVLYLIVIAIAILYQHTPGWWLFLAAVLILLSALLRQWCREMRQQADQAGREQRPVPTGAQSCPSP